MRAGLAHDCQTARLVEHLSDVLNRFLVGNGGNTAEKRMKGSGLHVLRLLGRREARQRGARGHDKTSVTQDAELKQRAEEEQTNRMIAFCLSGCVSFGGWAQVWPDDNDA